MAASCLAIPGLVHVRPRAGGKYILGTWELLQPREWIGGGERR